MNKWHVLIYQCYWETTSQSTVRSTSLNSCSIRIFQFHTHAAIKKKNSWVHIEFRIMNIKAATELWSWRTCWVSTCRLQPQSTARWKIVHKYELCSKGGFNSVVKTGQEAKAHVKALQRHKLQKNKPIIASVCPKIASKH